MSGSQQQAPPSGPPYLPKVAGLGGKPTVDVDVPICAVLICLYLIGLVSNATIFLRNRRRGHKFFIQLLMIWFCLARIVSCVLRIAWSTRQTNARLAIAAMIFFNAGILLLYLANILFVQRILRSMHPHFGWHPAARALDKAIYVLIICALILVITMVVLTFYTLNMHIRHVAMWVERGAITYLLIVAAAPIWVLTLCFLLPRHKQAEEPFGEGSLTAKVAIVALSSCLCTTIAGFRAGTTWETPRPITNPAWYDSKASFYCFNFMLEIFALYLLTFSRVDKRFHVPNGSSKRGTYLRENGSILSMSSDGDHITIEKKSSEQSV